MNGMFDRRARASEGSWGRDADKANLLKRKERLKAEGKLADLRLPISKVHPSPSTCSQKYRQMRCPLGKPLVRTIASLIAT